MHCIPLSMGMVMHHWWEEGWHGCNVNTIQTPPDYPSSIVAYLSEVIHVWLVHILIKIVITHILQTYVCDHTHVCDNDHIMSLLCL